MLNPSPNAAFCFLFLAPKTVCVRAGGTREQGSITPCRSLYSEAAMHVLLLDFLFIPTICMCLCMCVCIRGGVGVSQSSN